MPAQSTTTNALRGANALRVNGVRDSGAARARLAAETHAAGRVGCAPHGIDDEPHRRGLREERIDAAGPRCLERGRGVLPIGDVRQKRRDIAAIERPRQQIDGAQVQRFPGHERIRRIDDGANRHVRVLRAHDADRRQREAVVGEIDETQRERSAREQAQRVGDVHDRRQRQSQPSEPLAHGSALARSRRHEQDPA